MHCPFPLWRLVQRVDDEQARGFGAVVAAAVARLLGQREAIARAEHERLAPVLEAVGQRAAEDDARVRRLAPVGASGARRVLHLRPACPADVGLAVVDTGVVGDRLAELDPARIAHRGEDTYVPTSAPSW